MKSNYYLSILLISTILFLPQLTRAQDNINQEGSNIALVNTCWYGVHQYTFEYWKLEYRTGDSLFMTGYDANGTISYGRTHFGWYEQSNDTVEFIYLPWHPCGTDGGIYTVKFSNNQMYFTEVYDPCPGRAAWHITSERAHIKCDSKAQPLVNTCWVGFQKFTQAYYMLEFTQGDSLFLKGFDKNGNVIMPRQSNGNYTQSNDTLTFKMNPPGSSCGLDSGVYMYKFIGDNLRLIMVNDPCTDRVDFLKSNYNYFDCSNYAIDVTENVHLPMINIYPNPATIALTIESRTSWIKENTKIVLYDLMGKELLARMPGKTGNIYTLDVGHLSAGVYILKILQGHRVINTGRIVIQK